MSLAILIIDDDKEAATTLRRGLESLNYWVLGITSSLNSVREQFDSLAPDLIFIRPHLMEATGSSSVCTISYNELEIPTICVLTATEEATLSLVQASAVPYAYLTRPFSSGELRKAVEIALDRHRLEQQHKQSAAWMETILGGLQDGVMAVDRLGIITFINPAAEAMTGWTYTEALGEKAERVLEIIDEHSGARLPSALAVALESGHSAVSTHQSVMLRCRDGSEIPVCDRALPLVEDGLTVGAVTIVQDVSENRHLRRQALQDPLTQLPNRLGFWQQLEVAARYDRNGDKYWFGVLIIDLDRFQALNDRLGYSFGDRVLKAVAERLKEQLRSGDTIARLSGDEFALLVNALRHPQEAEEIATRILKALEQPLILDGCEEPIASASIGIATNIIPYGRVDELIRDADIALYQAKARGKGCYQVFDVSMREETLRWQHLESELRLALEQEELGIHYQPIVKIGTDTEQLDGFEALVRWYHPRQGRHISPIEFIPIAEASHLISSLGDWVMRQACQQMQLWQQQCQQDRPLTIAVNVSSRQLMQPDLIEQIEQILAVTGLEAQSLKIEITESASIEDPAGAARIFEQLKGLGIRLSLDDFGTGYSSLSHLHRFPIDTIKIDRSFIQGIDRDREGREIVRGIVSLAKTLKLDVIAEGVETVTQLKWLRELGCQGAQGYLFAKPLAPEAATSFLQAVELV